MNLEMRSLAEPVEFRGAANGTKVRAVGVAIRYGVASKPFPRAGRTIREEFKPSAFVKSLQERDVKALYEHKPEGMLGRTSSGTMRIDNGPKEMAYEIDLPDTTVGRDVAALLERRDVTGSSVAFASQRKDERWSVDDEGLALRSVGAAALDHIAPTCAQVHDETGVELALRSLSDRTGLELRSLIDRAASGENWSGLIGPDGKPLELRGDMTFDEQRDAVRLAILAELGSGDDVYVWVADLTDEWAVYELPASAPGGPGLYRRTYEIADDGVVTLTGEPVKVTRETSYVEAKDDERSDRGGRETTATAGISSLLY